MTDYGPKPLEEPDSVGNRFPRLDLDRLISEPPPPAEYLMWPLVERGRISSLYSPAKAGKSLTMLEWCALAAAGFPILGGPAREPVRILYLDFENSEADLHERLHALGYGDTPPGTLDNLAYVSFPPIAPLDTAAGGLELQALVDYYAPELVVIDTLSRIIAGEENSADTFAALYRYSMQPLKAQKISVVRLDHSGHEADRARGSSAKTSDIDSSWSLTYDEHQDQRTLKRTHSRTGHGPTRLVLDVEAEPLRHVLATSPDPVQELVTAMETLDLPRDWGRDRCGNALREAGYRPSKRDLTAAVKCRKDLPARPGQVPGQTPALGLVGNGGQNL